MITKTRLIKYIIPIKSIHRENTILISIALRQIKGKQIKLYNNSFYYYFHNSQR